MSLEADDFPPDYAERIKRVCQAGASKLRSCRGDLLAQLRVCCDFLESGKREGISHGELIDFLGVSSPSVLDRADYSDAEALRVMKALTLITYDSEGKPNAPSTVEESGDAKAEQTDFRF